MAIIRPSSDATFITNRNNANIRIGGLGAAFRPEIKAEKWGGEAFLIIQHPDIPGPPVDFTNGKIEQTVSTRIHRYFETAIGLRYELDYGATKPGLTEVFNLDFSAGLNFQYQPALTAEEIAEGLIRPDNVVGSYAVFHNKAHYQAGGHNYETGKFCHIYAMYLRNELSEIIKVPYIINPNGKILTVDYSSPAIQDFIAKAITLVLDPDLGYSTIGASASGGVAGYTRIGELDAFPAGGGTVNSISVYTKYADSAIKELIVALYDESGGTPVNLLAQSAATYDAAIGATPGWLTASLITPYAASASELLYIGRIQEHADSEFYWDTNAGYNMPSDYLTWPTLSDPWAGADSADKQLSAYLTYSTAGGVSLYKRSLGRGIGRGIARGL